MLLSCWWDLCLKDTHLNLQRFNPISRCFILWPSFACARNFRIMPWGTLHHLSSVILPHCEACELLRTANKRTLILQSLAVLLCSLEVQQFSFAVMELCVGWELTDVGSHKTSTWKCFCSVISWRRGAVIQTTTAVDCAADQTGSPGVLYIRFHFELRPFIHFWHLQLDRCTPLRGLLALRLHWGPTSHSGKTRCIWLALTGSTCVFCLACAAGGGERANYQPPLRDQYDVILPLHHNRLQMRGAGPLSSLIRLRKSRKA